MYFRIIGNQNARFRNAVPSMRIFTAAKIEVMYSSLVAENPMHEISCRFNSSSVGSPLSIVNFRFFFGFITNK
jgi:hypothetical protein